MSPAPSRVGRLLRRPAVLLALAFLALASLVSLIGRFTGPPSHATATALTNNPGSEMYPAFAPDGQQVAYSARARGAVERFHVFVKRRGGNPLQVTDGGANDVGPAWSPDGKLLAFARVESAATSYVVVPSGGGSERTVARFDAVSEQPLPARLVCWAAGGKSLVVVGRSGQEPAALYSAALDGSAPRRLTNPPAGSEGDFNPAVSTSGSMLAFSRRSGSGGEDIFAVAAGGGEPRRLTYDEHSIRGLAWTARGSEIVFASDLISGWRLWRIPSSGGTPKEIIAAGTSAQYPAVSVADRLAWCDVPRVSNIWRAPLGEGQPQALIASTNREFAPAYSPDGRRIAFVSDRNGGERVWVTDAAGGNPAQVSREPADHVMHLAWSPDQRSILYDARAEMRPMLFLAPFEAGKSVQARRLAEGGMLPAWSRDGRRIYFTRHGQIWRMAPDGSAQQPATKGMGTGPVESADGRFLYYYKRRGIWRVPVDGGEETLVVEPDNRFLGPGLAATAGGLYYLQEQDDRREIALYRFDPERNSSERVRTLPNYFRERAPAFDVSPDDRYVIYPRTDQNETDLMIVDRFR